MIELKRGPWKLSDIDHVEKHGHTVFSCFHCGGGSTMGYKLAGYTMLGGVDIDPEMMALYRANHNPKHSYLMGVQDFKNIPDSEIPQELFNLDILDGSPPCSSFSMAGSREKAWGEKKKFREGQADQILDDLFFHFIDVAKKLKPKVVVAENVKGLIQGNARGYVKEIFKALSDAGYQTQLFLLNASRMSVPQARERTFFIAKRKELAVPAIRLEFAEAVMTTREAWSDLPAQHGKPLSEQNKEVFEWCKANRQPDFAKFFEIKTGKRKLFNHRWTRPYEPSDTQTSTTRLCHSSEPRYISDMEAIRIQSFPDDYNFGKSDAAYVCGMSVPPFMMQRVSNQIHEQWLKKLNSEVPNS